MTRPVKVFEWKRPEGSDYTTPYTREFVGKGQFHFFGTGAEETENSIASVTSAIVEMPDGTVLNICVSLIQFTDKEAQT